MQQQDHLMKQIDQLGQVLGKLIAEMLSLLAESRNDWSKNLHEKCLTIYEWMQREEAVYSLERQWEIERIKNILEPSA